MNQLLIKSRPCDRVLFPGAQLSPEDEREDTTFYSDFKVAERFGASAVVDTFRRAFDEWRDNIKYLTELAAVLSHLCAEHCDLCHYNVSEFYGRAYLTCYDFVCKDGNFTAEEQNFFFRVLD